MTSANMQTYLRLVGKAGWGRHRAQDYLTDDQSNDAVFEAYSPDVEIHEPLCLPHGGVHHGREGWKAMHQTIKELWDQKFEILDLWEPPEDDVIILHAAMEWTARSTGRTARSPFIGVISFRDGLISKVEIFHQDVKAILDTLAPGR
jgi:hypothetical protein